MHVYNMHLHPLYDLLRLNESETNEVEVSYLFIRAALVDWLF